MFDQGQLSESLEQLVSSCADNPYRFVLSLFPWGSAGTELEGEGGPNEWQAEQLRAIRDDLQSGKKIVRVAIASGHGIGKSAFISWMILWAMATQQDCKGVITANTAGQLKGKTWAELAKWHRLCLCGHWFHVPTTAIYSKEEKRRATWQIECVPWNERNLEAFAGLHNKRKRLLLGYDEASAIPDIVWETSEGALTDEDTQIIWLAFGNPTRNTGRFKSCFAGGKFSHLWRHRQIDSRTVRGTNKALLEEWRVAYGEDSDFFRVRVLGRFPNVSSMQFISEELVNAAMAHDRHVHVNLQDPLILGVDCARFGDDKSVLRVRRGNDARSIKPLKFRGLDTMQLAARIAVLHEELTFDAIFIDAGTFGAGVVDRCRYLNLPARGIDFGAKADRSSDGDGVAYYNKRAEMWGLMRDWLPFGMLDPDDELKADLTGIEYGYAMKEGRDCLIMEKKEHMKSRGLSSPDDGDALALTFAYPVPPSDHSATYFGQKGAHEYDYDPYAQR